MYYTLAHRSGCEWLPAYFTENTEMCFFMLLLQSDAWWLCRNPSFLFAFFHHKQLYHKVLVEWNGEGAGVELQ